MSRHARCFLLLLAVASCATAARVRADDWAVVEAAQRDTIAAITATDGPFSPSLVPHLLHSAEAQFRLGRNAAADSTLARADDILDRNRLSDTADAGRRLMLLGINRYYQDRYKEMPGPLQDAIRLLDRLLPEDDDDLLRARNALAAAYMELSRHDEALELFRQILALKTDKYGEPSPEVAQGKHNLAETLFDTGHPQEAEALALEVLDALAATAALGPRDPLNVRTLVLLAVLCIDSGRFVEAKDYLDTAAEIQNLMPEDPDRRFLLHVEARLHFAKENYSAAIEACERALALIDGEGMDAALYLLVQGDSMVRMGLNDAARIRYERALDIVDALGGRHWRRGRILHQLANLDCRSRNFTDAESRIRAALKDYALKIPDNRRLISEAWTDLGEILIELGRKTEARAVLRKALDIAEAEDGERGFLTIRPHRALGLWELKFGRRSRSGDHYRAALEVARLNYGLKHTETAACLSALAELSLAEDDPDQALELALDSARIVEDHRRYVISTLVHHDPLNLPAARNPGLNISCAAALRSPDGEAIEPVWDRMLHSRGLVFEYLASGRLMRSEARRLGLSDRMSELEEATAGLAWQGSRGDLLTQDMNTAGESPLSDHAAAIQRLDQRNTEIRQRLAELSSRWSRVEARSRQGLDDAWTQLPSSSALVAYYRIALAPGGRDESYLAFVKRRDAYTPSLVNLGSAEEIDRLIRDWRETMEAVRVGVSEMHGGDSRTVRTAREAGEALRRRVWDPLADTVRDCEQVFLVPDAALSLVNFAALPLGANRYMIEEPLVIHPLSSERDLIPVAASARRASGLLSVGDPDYDAEAGESNTAPDLVTALYGHLQFGALDATRAEVDAVVGCWPDPDEAVALLGGDATETAVRAAIEGRRAVHLATHGFFFDPTRRDFSDGGLFERNPLLTSGLALAGANHGETPRPQNADGILSADDITLLDLDGCEWAVLSACNTGLGVLADGEGVIGLRRAFQQAGAHTVVMSLWEVNDSATKRLIERLFVEKYVNGANTAEAMRRAALAELQRRREKNQRTYPVDWGAFVAVGDWR